MNFKAPSLLWALVAAVAFWFLVIRKTAAAPALSQSQDQAGPTPISGAPVPDLGTALAGEQTSLLGSILTYLKGGSSGGGSIVAMQPQPVRSAGPSATGGATSSKTSTGSNQGLTIDQEEQNQQLLATEGAAFTYALRNAPGVPASALPLNLHASSGFGSDSYLNLQLHDALGSIPIVTVDSIGGGGPGGSGGGGYYDPGLEFGD